MKIKFKNVLFLYRLYWVKLVITKMSHFLVISITLTGIANSSCRNCNQNVELNINKQFTLSGNNIGHKEESSSFTVAGVDFGYNGTSYKTLSFTDIFGGVPPYGTRPSSEVFQKVDDYFP